MRLLIATLSLLLAACGFHLRGDAKLPFEKLYIIAPNLASPLIVELRSNLEASHVTLVSSPEQADMVLDISLDLAEKQILTLGGSGRVNEFQLRHRVSLRAYDNQQREWLPADELLMNRDYSYDDTQLLAKQAEESLLFQSMRSDMVQQIMRRLSMARPRSTEASQP